jgi:hypothetical protein
MATRRITITVKRDARTHLRLKLLPQPLLQTHQVHLPAVSSFARDTALSPPQPPRTFSSWIFDTSPRIFVICSSKPRFILSTSCTHRLRTRAQHKDKHRHHALCKQRPWARAAEVFPQARTSRILSSFS